MTPASTWANRVRNDSGPLGSAKFSKISTVCTSSSAAVGPQPTDVEDPAQPSSNTVAGDVRPRPPRRAHAGRHAGHRPHDGDAGDQPAVHRRWTPPPPSDEPPPPRDWRRWILGGLVALVVALGLALLLLDDDDDDGQHVGLHHDHGGRRPPPRPRPPPQPTTTTTAPTTTTTCAAVHGGPGAVRVIWARTTPSPPPRSCTRPSRSTTVPAPRTLPPPRPSTSSSRSRGPVAGGPSRAAPPQDVPDPHTLCSYRFEGGSTSFRMSYSETEGWTVYEVFQVAD